MNLTFIFLVILTFISRIIGLGREIALAYFYGASAVSDAYLISQSIPTVILGFVAAAIATSYIPLYRNLERVGGEGQFTNRVLHLVLVLSLAVFVFGMVFTPQLVPLFASGFDAPTTELTISLTRLALGGVFFIGMTHLLQGYMQVKEKVLLASLSGIPFNLVTILFIIASYRTSVYLLAAGGVLAVAAQWLYLLLLARRQGYQPRWLPSLKDPDIRQMIWLALPVMLASGVDQLDLLVDKTLASQYGPGGVSALSYAARTLTAIQGIFVGSLLMVLYPKIAAQAAKADLGAMKKTLGESFVGISLFLIPVITGVMLFSRPLVDILFGRGAFTETAAATTASILFFYIFSLLGSGFQTILSRAFFSLQDTKTPMVLSALTVILNIVLNLTISRLIGITGLALANSVASTIGMFLMFWALRRKIGRLGLGSFARSLTKLVLASAIMGGAARGVFGLLLPIDQHLALLGAAVMGAGLYALLILIMRIKEVEDLLFPLAGKIKDFLR